MDATHQTPATLADGRYRLGKLLGEGGFSRVFEAYDEVLGVRRAIKVMTVPERRRASLQKRLRAEARAMAKVEHPNVLRVLDVVLDADHDFVVMELVEGGTLHDLLDRDGPLRPLDALGWCLQVLAALGAAHDRGIVHRDVKPSNVLVDARGVALLADFGIALLGDEPDLRTTRMGVTMGTAGYMAPEQRVDARSVGPAADLYAAGTMLYVLLTQQNPTDLFAVDAEDHPRMARVPPPLRSPILRSVRYQPDQRFADAREMAASLAACEPALRALASHPPPSVPPHLGGAAVVPASQAPSPEASLAALTWLEAAQTPGPPVVRAVAAPPPARRTRVMPALGAIALAALALAGWRATRPPATTAPLPSVEPVSPVLEPAAPAPVAPVAEPPPPEPVVQHAPEPSVAPAAPTKPKPPPAASAEPPLGRWRGSHGGVRIELALGGDRAAPRGTVRTFGLTGTPQPALDVTGRYDAASRTLVVAEAPDHEPYATYDLTLSADGTTLEGRMTTSNGRIGTVSFRR